MVLVVLRIFSSAALAGFGEQGIIAYEEFLTVIDLLKKERTPDEKTTYGSRKAHPGATPGAQPKAHLTAQGVLQVAQEKPARGLYQAEKKSRPFANRAAKRLAPDCPRPTGPQCTRAFRGDTTGHDQTRTGSGSVSVGRSKFVETAGRFRPTAPYRFIAARMSSG